MAAQSTGVERDMTQQQDDEAETPPMRPYIAWDEMGDEHPTPTPSEEELAKEKEQ